MKKIFNRIGRVFFTLLFIVGLLAACSEAADVCAQVLWTSGAILTMVLSAAALEGLGAFTDETA